jgi:hypothetical protein
VPRPWIGAAPGKKKRRSPSGSKPAAIDRPAIRHAAPVAPAAAAHGDPAWPRLHPA